MKKSNFNVRRLTESAMMLAIATALALICAQIPFLNFPFGGGITIASMLPIILISYLYGVRWGLLCGFVYSIIQMLIGHVTVAAMFTPGNESYMGLKVALFVCLIDYLLAYTALGLGGLFHGRKTRGAALLLGTLVALGAKYLCHIVSGAVFFGAWAEWFFTLDGISSLFGQKILASFSAAAIPWIYSVIYNGLYMIPEMIITAAAAPIVSRIPFKKDI